MHSSGDLDFLHALSVTLMINDIVVMAQNAGTPAASRKVCASACENDVKISTEIETTWVRIEEPPFCPF